jgi:hypothetical protein
MHWKKLNEKFSPFKLLVLAVLLPLTAALFDQVYLNTVLRNGGQIAASIANISTQAAWMVSPEGYAYLHTERHVTSDVLWWMTSLFTGLLFLLAAVSNRRVGRQAAHPA